MVGGLLALTLTLAAPHGARATEAAPALPPPLPPTLPAATPKVNLDAPPGTDAALPDEGARAAVLVYRAPPPTKAVDPTPPPALGAVAAALREALALRGLRTEPGTIDQALQALRGRQTADKNSERLMALGGVREQIASAKSLVGLVELERAEAALEEAERRLWALPQPGETPTLLAETLRWRGVIRLLQRQEADAERWFRQSLALRPDDELSEAEVRPDVVAVFRRVAAALRAEPPLRLRLAPRLRAEGGASAPLPPLLGTALTLTLDGVEHRSETGLSAYPGRHLLAARLPGYQTLSTVIEVKRPPTGDVQDIPLELVADPVQTALLGLRASPTPRGLRALCAERGLQWIVIAAPGRDAGAPLLVGQRFTCATTDAEEPALARGAATTPLATLARDLVEQLFTRSEPRPKAPQDDARPLPLLEHPTLRTPRPPPRRPVPLYAQPWPYVIGAALATGVLLGAILWPRPGPQTQVVLNPSSFP